jgi:hypothetical protein
MWTFTISGSNGYAFATSKITLQAGTYTASAIVDNGDFIILKGSVTQPNTFTLTEDTEITFRVYKNGNIGDVVKLSNVMIEKGSTASEYEAYKGQSYEINLGNIELCKIGDYQDRIYYNNGKWYLEKKIGKVVLNGSESWNMYGSSGQRKWYLPKAYFGNEVPFTNAIDKSNRFTVTRYISGNWQNNKFGYHASANSMIFDTDFGESVTDWTTWLSTHNVEVVDALATPTVEEITDSTLLNDLNNLEDAKSYNGTTNIIITGETPADLKITALKNE